LRFVVPLPCHETGFVVVLTQIGVLLAGTGLPD
jgi:hypothetical protein